MAELVLRLRVAGQGDVQAALQSLGASAKDVTERTTRAVSESAENFRGSMIHVREFGRELAGLAAVASVVARNNPELQRQFEVLSLTLSGAGASVRAVGGALRLLALSPIALVVAAIAGLIAVGILLYKHWDEVKAFAIRTWGAIKNFLGRVFEGL
jgi:hypothetical protein